MAPDRLFKYMNREVGKLVLTNRTLRWSTPGTLNDPYDMQFDFGIEVDTDRVKSLAHRQARESLFGNQIIPAQNKLGAMINFLRGKLPNVTEEDFHEVFGKALDEALARFEPSLHALQADLRGFLANCKILCLTTKPSSLLMWHRYADACRGIVLRFKNVEGLDSPWSTARCVSYRSSFPSLMNSAFLADMLSGRATMDGQAIMHQMVYTKTLSWAYEDEWRIFTGEGRDPKARFEDIQFNRAELDAVILGHHMAANDKEAFSAMVRSEFPHAELLQVRKTAQIFFELEIIPL